MCSTALKYKCYILIFKSNPKGCDSKCNNLHPIACRDSIKSRECARDKCRFYHLKGTKKPDTLSSPQVHSQSAPVTQGTSQPQTHSVQNAMPMQNQNLTQSSPNVRFNSTPQQVFQVDQTAILTTLQLMMEEMRSWRNQSPPQVQPNLQPQVWSQGSLAPQLGWGSPSNLTQSQSQSQSQ